MKAISRRTHRQRQAWKVRRVPIGEAEALLNHIVSKDGEDGYVHTAQATEDGELVVIWWTWED